MKKISIVIPVWNEEKNIIPLVKRIHTSLKKAKITYELIFIDDNSTDNTLKILKKICKKYPISFFAKQGKKGKAFSLIEGFKKASYDVVAMIDADLQYPPEALPKMMTKIRNGADIVVANRSSTHTSKIRKYVSTSFRYFFGKVLFGITYDIQAGLKIFKKPVLKQLEIIPDSGWTFDLELLHKAKNAGYIIESVNIVFEKREYGKSKVSLVRTSMEIGLNALKVKLKPIVPLHIKSKKRNSMEGAGIRFKGNTYITHSSLHYSKSAIETFIFKQKIFFVLLIGVLLISFIFKPLLTLQLLVGTLSFVYFADVIFNLFLVIKSLHSPREISSSIEELQAITDSELPHYSILCPLYKEAHIIPQFLESISKIDYPKNKLDVMLLLEEDDKGSITAVKKMELPHYVRVIVVPHSFPKTKPKACNYGLAFAKGEYLVIYDAEDDPDPLQLKKAYLGFQKADKNVFCLQAKLNYYNPHQNLLTRFFTAEYSLWFDVTLLGLQAMNTSLPLGGTSNHFKTANIRKLEGWDPFNVTEDADLGIRLFKLGYKTAIIDSVTLEEANSNWGNWLRQRSRWIKGYMQTYLVHTRDNFIFLRKSKLHALIFHLVIGGKIAFILVNPLLWLVTLSYFTLHHIVGPAIDAAYPAPVLYMAIISLVFGNFLFLFYYMIGCAKKEQWGLIKYVFLIPLYWIMISVAGGIAFYQLLFKPHYWEKTVHGLHLKNIIPELVVEIEEAPSGVQFPIGFRRKLLHIIQTKRTLLSGGTLIGATMLANVLNLIFNIVLGKYQRIEDYGMLSVISGLIYLSSIPMSALSATVNYQTGYIDSRDGHQSSYFVWKSMRKYAFYFGVLIAFIWLALSPLILKFFASDDIIPIAIFAFVWVTGFAMAVDRGYLGGKLWFASLGLISLIEPVTKVIMTAGFANFDRLGFAYTAIILPFILNYIIGYFGIKTTKPHQEIQTNFRATVKLFSKKFYIASLLSGLSAMVFLSIDIVLAKHYLSARDAGIYALISLIGKIIYFLGSINLPFIIPLISRDKGNSTSTKKALKAIFQSTFILTLIGLVIFGIFGKFFVPFILGPTRTNLILPYILPFSFAMMCFSLSRVVTSYYLAKKSYSFPIVGFFLTVLQFALLYFYHSGITQFVMVMVIIGIASFAVMLLMHIFIKYVISIENNLVDFIDLFFKEQEPITNSTTSLRILIFNWRDTKHAWAGGAETYIQEIAKRLVKQGNTVTIFCGNDRKHPRRETIDGINIIRRGGFHTVYLWAVLYYVLRLQGKFDVIIDSENGVPFFTPLFVRKPIYLLIHHIHQEVFRTNLVFPFSLIAQFIEGKCMPAIYKKNNIITVSESSKNEIIKIGLGKKSSITIIHPGIDLTVFKQGQKTTHPSLLYLGRLKSYKNIDTLIHAFSLVKKKHPTALLTIAGSGDSLKSLQKLTQKLGIVDSVIFKGNVSEEEKILLLQQSWIALQASMVEGWGITVIEANASGTPVIASHVKGLQDSIIEGQTGILVPVKNSIAFANAIDELLTNDWQRTQLAEQAIIWAQNFSWEQTTKELQTLLIKHLRSAHVTSNVKITNRHVSNY